MKRRELDIAIAADVWKIFLPPIKRGMDIVLASLLKLSNDPVITSALVQELLQLSKVNLTLTPYTNKN